MTEDALPCVEVVELLNDHLDGALDAATARRVEAHLALCPPCVTYLDQLRATAGALGRLSGPALPEELTTALEAAFADFRRERQ
ncbi:MAG: anti-sigma factor family protein [Blastococcus sp.]